MAVQIQLRRDTAANWTSNDPTLAGGEIGLETNTGKIKLGDGSTAWTSLDYIEAAIDHDNLANGGAHDYAYISGNDGATGVTAAELEELSDGSETTLHSHAGGNGGAFTSRCSVYRDAPQTIATGTWTKVQLETEDYDIDSEFDNVTNYRFQPDVTGHYGVNLGAEIGSLGDTKLLEGGIYKNGVLWRKTGKSSSGVQSVNVTFSYDMYLLDTDYIELWVRHSHGSNRDILGYIRNTFMDVHRFA